MLGAGTTVIPEHGGDLADYMDSLRRLLALEPAVIYPAHGPAIHDAGKKIREYIAHRELREAADRRPAARGRDATSSRWSSACTPTCPSSCTPPPDVGRSHLRKLERDGRARRDGEEWALVAAEPG